MMKTAILGLGLAAEHIHLPACQQVEGLELVAGCDPVAARRAQMQARFGLPAVYADAETLLKQEQPELVIVVAPPAFHKALCLQALNAGAHVLCEKPFMNTLDEADEVIAAAEAQGRLLAVNNQYRYMATYRVPQRRLAAGEFGRAFYIQCWQQMFHPPATDKTPWRQDLKQSTLFEFGSHVIDLACFFFGALPEAVNAVTPRVRPDYDSDVLVQMTLYFPDERLATISLNRVTHAPERYIEMRVDCEKASLRLSVGGVARASVNAVRYGGKVRPSFRFSYVKGGEARMEVGSQSTVIATEAQNAVAPATAAHLRELLTEIRGGMISQQRAHHARDILRVIFAGYESAARREIIELSKVKA